MSVSGGVPTERSARLYSLAEGPEDDTLPSGKEVILLEGGAVALDGVGLKHVVIRNATVFYSGGPVQMEDVAFVNCTFVLDDMPRTREFASSVLREPSSTTFHAS
jgi:hypothetical protein